MKEVTKNKFINRELENTNDTVNFAEAKNGEYRVKVLEILRVKWFNRID